MNTQRSSWVKFHITILMLLSNRSSLMSFAKSLIGASHLRSSLLSRSNLLSLTLAKSDHSVLSPNRAIDIRSIWILNLLLALPILTVRSRISYNLSIVMNPIRSAHKIGIIINLMCLNLIPELIRSKLNAHSVRNIVSADTSLILVLEHLLGQVVGVPLLHLALAINFLTLILNYILDHIILVLYMNLVRVRSWAHYVLLLGRIIVNTVVSVHKVDVRVFCCLWSVRGLTTLAVLESLVQRRWNCTRRWGWRIQNDIWLDSSMSRILSLRGYKHHISLSSSLRISLNLLLHVWSCNRMIPSFSQSIDMIGSSICRWIAIRGSLIHHCWGYEHLWTVATLKLILLLIRLRMWIFSHIKILIYQVIVDNLVTVHMGLLAFLLTISLRRSNSKAWYSCPFLRFKLYLWLLNNIILGTLQIRIVCRILSLLLHRLGVDKALAFFLLSFLISKLKLSHICTFLIT